MKSAVRRIATTTIAALLAPAWIFGAEGAKKPTPEAREVTTAASHLRAGAVESADPSAGTLAGQAATTVPPAPGRSGKYPRAELFFGYSYLRGVPTLSPGNRMEWLNGGSASVAFNLNRYLGIVGDFGGFKATELDLTGAGANPARAAKASGTAFTYMAGPRLSFRKYDRFTPFAQALVGGVHASEVTLSGSRCTPLPTENALVLAAGGGLDLKVHRHIAIRLVQAEYFMTRFADLTTGNRQTQNDVRLSTGVVLGFGGNPVSLPVSYACAASPASVYPGDPVTVTGTALNLNPKKTATYTWAADGGRISGATSTATIDTGSAALGSYTATGKVSEGAKPGQSASCTAAYTVAAFQPPTVSCSANPSSVHPGESATITAQGISPQNRPLTYSFSASDGSISGANSSAMLTTASAGPGTITVTCNVVDDKGQTASATTTVAVQAPPPPSAPTAQKLCSISFERDRKRPTRVDNEAKACLDDVALTLQRSADAKLAVVGNSAAIQNATDKKALSNEAAQRAVNIKEYLVTDKGLDASRITAFAGPDGNNTADMTLVPAGATLNPTGLTPVDESVSPIPRKAGLRKR
jgi:opacity protein-like surface antigen/outer membrane protein OmpA-like peptidoglycan-associated protein